MLVSDFGFYLVLGFVAQLIDGALGMAYGLIATSALLASGASPAIASASVHAAECVTSGLAGASHAGTATWIGAWSSGWPRRAWRVASLAPSS
jgi:uncharacterized membrane protein YfcA